MNTMKTFNTKLALTIFSSLNFYILYSQSIVNTCGDNSSGTTGTISYSVGQIHAISMIGTNGSINSGIQQPYNISITTGIDKIEIDLEITTYPNPTVDYLNLSFKKDNVENFYYQLYDCEGKLLLDKEAKFIQTFAVNN